MIRTGVLPVAALSLALSCGPAVGQSFAPTPKQTVVPNFLPGSSYLRLYGTDPNKPTTFELRTVGTASGHEYQVQDITTQPLVSRQINPQDIIDPNSLLQGDETVMVIIKGKKPGLTDIAGLYQHVRFNQSTRILENMSECTFSPVSYDLGYYRSYYVQQGTFLPHLHTSRLAGYTSYISITNPDDVARTFRITATNPGENGTVLSDAVTVPAGSTQKVSFPELEQRNGWTPAANQIHVNVNVGHNPQPGETGYLGTAVISHTVWDENSHVETNLAQYCPVEGISTVPDPAALPYPQTRQETAACIPGGWEFWEPGQCPVVDFPASITTAGEIRGDISVNGGLGSGGAANGQVYPAGDTDWYKVQLEKGGTYRIYATPRPTDVSSDNLNGGQYIVNDGLYKSRLRVRDFAGTAIALQTWQTGRADNSLIFTADQAGEYFVEVAASDGESTGGYQLVVNSIFKADPCSPLDEQDLYVAENQCNDGGGDFPADITTPGLVCINCASGPWSSLLPETDVDWHRVYLVAGTTYQFEVTPVGNGLIGSPLFFGLTNRRMELLSPSGTVLASDTGFQATTVPTPTCPVPAENEPNEDGVEPEEPAPDLEPCEEEIVDPNDPARFQYTATDTGYHYIAISSEDGVSYGGYKITVSR